MTGQLGAKWVNDERYGLTSHTTAQLVAGRMLYDVTRRFDLAFAGRSLRAQSSAIGVGAELGWSAVKNLRLAAGYNVFGFRDRDLTGFERTDRGPYLNLGWKFDESMFEQTPNAGGPR